MGSSNILTQQGIVLLSEIGKHSVLWRVKNIHISLHICCCGHRREMHYFSQFRLIFLGIHSVRFIFHYVNILSKWHLVNGI